MTSSYGRGAAMCTAAFALVLGMAMVSAQSGTPLSALTVPATNLPGGCQLAPPSPLPSPFLLLDGTTIRRPPYPGKFPVNPWFGTEDRYKTEVQNAIEPAPPVQMPDGPPLDRKQASKLMWSLRGQVAEAYYAAYQATSGASIVVQAVRYTDPKWATADPRQNNRIVRGSTVIRVDSTEPTGCMNVVWTYIQSLK